MTVKSKTQQLKKNRKPKKKTNPRIEVSPFQIATWYIQENSAMIPEKVSKALLGAFRSRDVNVLRKVIAEYGSPQLYENHDSYFVMAQLFALLSKVPFPFGGGDQGRKEEALRKFYDSEKRCKRTTRRLDHFNRYPNREDDCMRQLLARARVLVDKVLGSVDNAGFKVLDGARFGPGMTYCSIDRSATTPFYKLTQKERTVTASCKPYANLAIQRCPQWAALIGDVDMRTKTVTLDWTVVTSCKLTFVPKDERTFRTIAIEPYGNVFLQLGVHEFIRARLKSHADIDISSQKRNQVAARYGSENWDNDGALSTIDLSSASDCVSPGLVRRLVRPQWVAFLDDLRCKYYTYENQERELHKWSSMGNGYTFALETLLFWALAQSCEDYCGTGNKALAYGDDIIVTKHASLLTLQLLRYTGFKTNLLKTFVNGPFRESCGADFHSGVSVRPVFLKSFELRETDCYSFLNQLKVKGPFRTDLLFEQVLNALPKDDICWGPPTESADTHLHAPFWWLHKYRPKGFRWNTEDHRQYHRTLVFKTKSYGGFEAGKYITWLYNTQHRDTLGEDNSSVQITRRSRGFYRVRSTPCSFWGMAVRDYFFLTKG